MGCSETSKDKAQDKEIEELKKKVTVLETLLEQKPMQPVQHHYELRTEGTRSFRFDPETGDSCIKLASKADWKNPDTIRQGCDYQDYMNGPYRTDDITHDEYKKRLQVAECLYVGKCPK